MGVKLLLHFWLSFPVYKEGTSMSIAVHEVHLSSLSHRPMNGQLVSKVVSI